MAYSLHWNIHPDVLCRQYEKQACEDLFLKPGNDSTIWMVDPSIATAHSPVLSIGSTLTCVDKSHQTAASSTDSSTCIENQCEPHALSSKTQIKEGSDVTEVCSKNPRLFHIKNSRHSWSRLDVTQQIFDDLCGRLEIFEAFKEMVAFMGRRFYESEVAPPRCEWQITKQHASPKPEARVESAYMLRYVDLNAGNDTTTPWSLRQLTVYNHQSLLGADSWVFISLPSQVMSSIDQYVKCIDVAKPFQLSLQLHISFMTFTLRCWRPYLIYLAEEVDACDGKVTCAAPPKPIRIDLSRLRVRMKNLESQLDDTLLAVRTNSLTTSDVLTLFLEYLSHHESSGAESRALKTSLITFHTKCNNDYAVTILKIESLRYKIQSCIQMASSFAEIKNGQSLSENSQLLRKLAEEQGEEARHMATMANKSRREATAVKGLSIITLIYLPTTVVLNFFSASFIDTSSGGLVLVGRWWLFLVVGLPLTVVTLAAWGLWMRYGLPKAERKRWDLEKAQ